MAKIGKHQAAQVEEMDGFEGRYEELGGYTVGFEAYSADQDSAPLFQGLPDDRCQCPHGGVVLKGTLVYRYTDGSEEVITAGEAYYARPGHLPVLAAGTVNRPLGPTQIQFCISLVMPYSNSVSVSARK